MIRHDTRTGPLRALAVGAMLAAMVGTATADDRFGERRGLERRDWWPYASGPHYGEVPETLRFHPRVVRLPVGSFDTRGRGLELPAPLRLAPDQARRPGAPWLVQLEGPVTEARKAALRAAGATIHGFHPVNTFVVRAAAPARLATLPGVLWAGPYHPGYRIEPALGRAPTLDPAVAANERIFVRVRLFDPGDRPGVVDRLRGLGAAIDPATYDEHEPPDRIYFRAAPPAIVAAARFDEVSWVEEVSLTGFTLNAETKVFMQSGFVNGGTPLWDAGVDGSTQVVGDMDSGLDVDTILVSETALDAGTPGFSHRKVLAYSAWGGGDVSTCAGTSGYSHGTNTTQCAVGNRTDLGLNGDLEGIAHGAKVVFQDIGPSDFICCLIGCLSPPASLFGMYDEVLASGGHLTNGSFAICDYGTYGGAAFDADQYAWDHKSFLGFFSGGNGGGGNACPGTNKNNISSGGHFQDPFQNEFYGSTGPSPDGRMGPTVLGPACDHAGGNLDPEFNYNTSASIQSSDNDITGTPSSSVNEGSCGTSFSSPWLMGAAALIRDYFEKGFYPSDAANGADAFSPSGALVKAALINSGDFMSGCVGCANPGLMGSMGMGRVNLSNTLAIGGDARTPQGIRVIDRGMSEGLGTGQSFEEQLEILDTAAGLRVTLVWVDRPGSTLTNDLRLTVVGPAGGAAETYRGNNFGSGAYSISEAAGGTSEDLVNVFESVRIDPAELASGTWTVRVEGANVPMGDPDYNDTQPFALIAAGGFDSSPLPPEVSPAGSGQPLRATAVTVADVTWEWEALTDPAVTYSFYRGTIDSLRAASYDHAMIDGTQCGLAGNTATVGDAGDGVDAYYLVAARKNGSDGSLGQDSAGADRPAADPVCP